MNNQETRELIIEKAKISKVKPPETFQTKAIWFVLAIVIFMCTYFIAQILMGFIKVTGVLSTLISVALAIGAAVYMVKTGKLNNFVENVQAQAYRMQNK